MKLPQFIRDGRGKAGTVANADRGSMTRACVEGWVRRRPLITSEAVALAVGITPRHARNLLNELARARRARRTADGRWALVEVRHGQ